MTQTKSELENKLKEELKDYKNKLLNFGKEEIINKSYELVIKEELIYMIDKLNDKELVSIYNKEESLDYLYYLWMKNDINLIELLEDSIKYELDKDIKQR